MTLKKLREHGQLVHGIIGIHGDIILIWNPDSVAKEILTESEYRLATDEETQQWAEEYKEDIKGGLDGYEFYVKVDEF